MKRVFLFLSFTVILFLSLSAEAQVILPTAAPGALSDSYLRSQRLGITFISSTAIQNPAERYRQALLLGAGWNRWPLYWNEVERSAGNFSWEAYDRLVDDDLRQGLNINAILMGRPEFYHAGDSISGLHEPIFSDGTDTPGAGKTPNPNNPWASFVYAAVMRYKPGGLLAQQFAWTPGKGITVWEAWNEPDFELFWRAGVSEYARLLKVTYLAAHSADPNARVMFGGLANNSGNNWLAQVLQLYSQDPGRTAYNWYFDQVAVHSYTYAAASARVVAQAKRDLAAYGLSRPIWLNESGVPVWDDYPGPTWATGDPSSRYLRATAEQAAAYVIQSTVYAWAEGADVVFYHQLYDDCGNQPSGTNFPPHNGELCTEGSLCWGDAHGLYTNERSSACFSQHPTPGSPRPAATSFHMLAQIFGSTPFSGGLINTVGAGTTVITFDRQTTGERIHVMWNRTAERVTLDLPAGSAQAALFDMDNNDYALTPTNGLYQIGLSPATPDNFPYISGDEAAGIGGAPMILVEQVSAASGAFNPALMNISVPASVPGVRISPTPGAIQLVRPTTEPALDTRPPITSMIALPEISTPTFTVAWRAQEDGGIERYLVWVRVNGGEWEAWLETPHTEAQYTGTPGNTYEFAVWAVDLAGNWSPNVELVAQAFTRVE